MRSLIERFGGLPVVAPSMQEVPLEQNSDALAAVRKIVKGEAEYMILLTGVGTDAMLNTAATKQLEDPLLHAMKQIPLLIRGPKPAVVLKRLGLKYAVKAPEPNTWRELLVAIDDAGFDLKGQTVAVQEYGVANPELYDGLQQRGATVLPVPVYRWALPNDVEPLKDAVEKTVAGEVDVLLFTSAQQVRHVLQVAEQPGCQNEWLDAANAAFVASIGPTCTETLKEGGLNVGYEANPPKMGPLVRGSIATWKN